MRDTILGYLHGGTVDAVFLDSITNMLLDADTQVAGVISVETGPALCTARNKLASIFMNEIDEADASWLFCVDTDMEFEPDTIARLRRHARPSLIVGALCFAFETRQRTMKPTLYTKDMHVIYEYEPGALVPVHATGAACLMVHRQVFKEIPYPWFVQCPEGTWGEDQGFCSNAHKAGISVAVDTSTCVGHSKRLIVGERDWKLQWAGMQAAQSDLVPSVPE